MSSMLFGAIADDITGATDLASVLMRGGCRVVQSFGVPRTVPSGVDAVVIATKSRMAPVDEARAIAAEARAVLAAAGADQIFFKYCSTFDSTEHGNIGPVVDLLLDAGGGDFTIACPSYPALGRTVYRGHMFVGDRLLSESPMRDHPLTPMRNPDLVRFLRLQTPSRVGLVDLATVAAGPAALRARFAALRADGVRVAIADAIFDAHIDAIADACRDLPLVTGGAALGGALGRRRIGGVGSAAPVVPPVAGPAALLSGSCSAMTRAQIAHVLGRIPAYRLEPTALAGDDAALGNAIDWAVAHAAKGDFLVYSSAEPEVVAAAQRALGLEQAAAGLEGAFSAIAAALAAAGVRRFVVAGGETSGAVSRALDVRMMAFGREIAPGVPLTYTLDPEGYALILKSGNFGDADFFDRAREAM